MLNKKILKTGLICLAGISFGLIQAEGLPGGGFGDWNPPTVGERVDCLHNGEIYRSWIGADSAANPNPCPETMDNGMVINWDFNEDLFSTLLHNANLSSHGHAHKLDPEDEHCDFGQEVSFQ